jgi:hypothetical protein
MKQILQNITEKIEQEERMKIENIRENRRIKIENLTTDIKIKIERELCFFRDQIGMKLNINELKQSIIKEHSEGRNEVKLFHNLIIDTDWELWKESVLQCNCKKDHNETTCIVIQYINDIIISFFDKNDFNIKMKLTGKIMEKNDWYAHVWRINLKFEL